MRTMNNRPQIERKSMKKALSIILSIALLVTLIPVTVSADYADTWKPNTYTITANATGKLDVYLEHNYHNDSSFSVDVYKRTSSNGSKTLCYNFIVSADGPSPFKLPTVGCTKGDVFILEITSYQKVYFKVTYRITPTSSYEKELNNTFQTATTIKPNGKISGNCSDYNIDGEVDYFKVTSPIKGSLTLKFKYNYMNSGWGWYVSVYKKAANGSFTTLVNQDTISTKQTSDSITINKVTSGTTYYIKVEWPYSGNFSAHEYMGTNYTITPVFKYAKPGTPKTSSIKKSKVKFTWKKSSGCSGYQIQISKKSSFKKNVVNKTKSKNNYSKTLSRKKTYYIRVRSYKTVKGIKYYSSWSKTKKFKTK